MAAGLANFFASLDPETQGKLIQAASQALGAQHRSIGKNTANAGRVRDHLVNNDAYARETAQRAGLAPEAPASESGSGVGDFQRMNEAFMKLQGDDMMPAKAAQDAPVTGKKPQPANGGGGRQIKQGADTKTTKNTPVSGTKPANPEQDEATSDLRRDKREPLTNTAQDEATSSGRRDKEYVNAEKGDTQSVDVPVNYKVPPTQEDEDDSSWLDPRYLFGLAGARAVRRGGPPVSSNPQAGGVPEVASPRMQMPPGTGGDDIMDAVWSDAHDIPQEVRTAIEPPQRLLSGPSGNPANDTVARAIPAPETADIDPEEIMEIVRREMSAPQSRMPRPGNYGDIHSLVDEVMGGKAPGTGIRPPSKPKAPRVK